MYRNLPPYSVADETRREAEDPRGLPSSGSSALRGRRRFLVLGTLGCAALVAAALATQPAAANSWKSQAVPTPAHSDDAGLDGVSCTLRTGCVAVGWSVPSDTDEPVPLVEHWNGSTWSIEPTPIPRAPGWGGGLSAVSCTSSRACIAVGSFDDDAVGEVALVERWNGAAWSIQPTPQLDNANVLEDVSCTSKSDCTAVGYGDDSMAAHWDGTRWSVEKVRFGDPQGRANQLSSVSCPSQSTCAAAGWDDIGLCADEYESDFTVPVLGFRTRGSWSLRRHPDIECSRGSDNGGGSGLNAISCTSAAQCTAVGADVYRWDGHRWSLQPAPNGTDQLNGVVCTARNACTAVGSRVYAWNGSRWSTVRIARPAGALHAGLADVSCTSPSSCVAVGGYEAFGGRSYMWVESTHSAGRARDHLKLPTDAGIAVATTARRLSKRH